MDGRPRMINFQRKNATDEYIDSEAQISAKIGIYLAIS